MPTTATRREMVLVIVRARPVLRPRGRMRAADMRYALPEAAPGAVTGGRTVPARSSSLTSLSE